MRWLSIAKKDGSKDPYCIGLVSHTVTHGDPESTGNYLAWRIKSQGSDLLGGFPTPDAARRACQEDADARR